MNIAVTKTSFWLILMIILLLMAIITNDVIDSKIFTSFSIITGVFIFKYLSTETKINNE